MRRPKWLLVLRQLDFDAVALGGIAFCLHGSNFFLIFAEFSLAKERQWISSCIALYKKNTMKQKRKTTTKNRLAMKAFVKPAKRWLAYLGKNNLDC